jgi:RNA polymerase sigma-70 factor (ECF subfamily)
MSDPPDLIVHLPRLRRYARALTGGNAASADDLVQDTLERAWARLHQWQAPTDGDPADPAERLRAWLFTLMHNVHLNQVRQRRLPTDPLDGVQDDLSAPSVSGGQLETLALRDIQAALANLPLPQREVLLLVGLEEFSYAEAAAVLDVPVGTVMSRLSRARAAMRVALSHPVVVRPGAAAGWKVVK